MRRRTSFAQPSRQTLTSHIGADISLKLEINAHFDLLDITLQLESSGACEAGKRLIAEAKKIVLELRRPIGCEGIFEAGTDQPSAVGVRCRRRAARCQLGNAG